LPPVSLIPVVNLYLRISLRIFEKIRNGPNGILWGWGETDSLKKPEAKNLVKTLQYYFKMVSPTLYTQQTNHIRGLQINVTVSPRSSYGLLAIMKNILELEEWSIRIQAFKQ
jgi:hypothetical protein